LIEAAGLKGMRVGGAEVSDRHANFFVAHPGATAHDVFHLVAVIRSRVLAAFGVELVPEIRFVGEFR
jgi:UDP-N-acetylmuramate dehydrogenase